MPLLGLICYPLSHSFSQRYFRARFARTGHADWDYALFPIETAGEMWQLWTDHPDLLGLNVTIPHKQAVLPFLDELHPTARAIGAVNTIKRQNGRLVGYNTDVLGFETSLRGLLGPALSAAPPLRALVLGTGGASLAVRYILDRLSIPFRTVSRSADRGDLRYAEVTPARLRDHRLVINTTPLGMAPHVAAAPALPYAALTEHHFLYDLIYNPAETLFLEHGKRAGATTTNGLRMLELQAEAAWDIWTGGV